MRKSLWVIPVVFLFTVVAAPSAHADITYVVSFSGANAPTVVGSPDISYSTTFHTFDTPSFQISYFGSPVAMDVVPNPTFPNSDMYDWSASVSVPGGVIEIDDTTLCTMSGFGCMVYIGGPLSPNAEAGEGLVTFAPLAATPEPATSVMALLGCGILFALRKRIAQGNPQAT